MSTISEDVIDREVAACRAMAAKFPVTGVDRTGVVIALADERNRLRAENAALLATLEHSATHKALAAMAAENAKLREQLAAKVGPLASGQLASAEVYGSFWECDKCGGKVNSGSGRLDRLDRGDYRCPNQAHPNVWCDGLLKWQHGNVESPAWLPIGRHPGGACKTGCGGEVSHIGWIRARETGRRRAYYCTIYCRDRATTTHPQGETKDSTPPTGPEPTPANDEPPASAVLAAQVDEKPTNSSPPDAGPETTVKGGGDGGHRTHRLKTVAPFFDDVASGRKTFEIRKNDRGFKEGDTWIADEYRSGYGYTGRAAGPFRITYVTPPSNCLPEGLCGFSFEPLRAAESSREPGQLGSVVPAGYMLGDGWRQTGGPLSCDVCRKRFTDGLIKKKTLEFACADHAFEMGALVPVEPTRSACELPAPQPEAPSGFRVIADLESRLAKLTAANKHLEEGIAIALRCEAVAERKAKDNEARLAAAEKSRNYEASCRAECLIEIDRLTLALAAAERLHLGAEQAADTANKALAFYKTRCEASENFRRALAKEGDRLTAKIAEDEKARMNVCPFPKSLDGTEGACPAWWRGEMRAATVWKERLQSAEKSRDAFAAAVYEEMAGHAVALKRADTAERERDELEALLKDPDAGGHCGNAWEEACDFGSLNGPCWRHRAAAAIAGARRA